MESSSTPPTRAQASAALAEAEATRAKLAGDVVLPSWFHASIGAAISVQVATTAVTVAEGTPWALVAGLALVAVVVGVQLLRFSRRNGVWIGSLADRVLGGGFVASFVYGWGLIVAISAARSGLWWVVAIASLAAGTTCALTSRHWMNTYRAEPEAHGRGSSAVWFAVTGIAGIAALVVVAFLRW